MNTIAIMEHSKTSMPNTIMGPNYSYIFQFESDFQHEVTKGWFLVSLISTMTIHFSILIWFLNILALITNSSKTFSMKVAQIIKSFTFATKRTRF